MDQAVTSWLQIPEIDFFHSGIQTLVPRKGKCFKANNECVKCDVYHVLPCVQCVTMCYHVHVSVKVRIKFLASSVRYLIFLKILSIHVSIPDKLHHFVLVVLYCIVLYCMGVTQNRRPFKSLLFLSQ